MGDRKPASPEDMRRVRQIRRAATVMAATMVIWMGAQFLGSQMGWPTRFVFLFDIAAMAALVEQALMALLVWRLSD